MTVTQVSVPAAICVRPAEAARRLSIGQTKLYAMLAEGRLSAVKLGQRCTLIPISEIEKLLAI